MAREGLWTAAEGMWLSSSVLLPIGISYLQSSRRCHTFQQGRIYKVLQQTKQKQTVYSKSKALLKQNLSKYRNEIQYYGNILNISKTLADIKAGKFVIVVDDQDRENEGDFICAAEKSHPKCALDYMVW